MHSGGLRSEVDHGARLAAVGACWLLLALSAVGAIGITHFDDPNVGVILLLQCVPYAIATWLVVWGRPDRAASGRALATILLVGVAMRCLLLPGTPVSNDLFRYVWDGRVQAAGINPYLHVPRDAALSGLRDGAIYPYVVPTPQQNDGHSCTAGIIQSPRRRGRAASAEFRGRALSRSAD